MEITNLSKWTTELPHSHLMTKTLDMANDYPTHLSTTLLLSDLGITSISKLSVLINLKNMLMILKGELQISLWENLSHGID